MSVEKCASDSACKIAHTETFLASDDQLKLLLRGSLHEQLLEVDVIDVSVRQYNTTNRSWVLRRPDAGQACRMIKRWLEEREEVE